VTPVRNGWDLSFGFTIQEIPKPTSILTKLIQFNPDLIDTGQGTAGP
jgi:hypothetical protein